eukprot:3940525-Rhodomonas_salina.1
MVCSTELADHRLRHINWTAWDHDPRTEEEKQDEEEEEEEEDEDEDEGSRGVTIMGERVKATERYTVCSTELAYGAGLSSSDFESDWDMQAVRQEEEEEEGKEGGEEEGKREEESEDSACPDAMIGRMAREREEALARVCGTEVAYDAMRRAVLRQRMVCGVRH